MAENKHGLLRLLAKASFWAYFAALVVLGLAGIFVPVQELNTMYDIQFDTWPEQARVSMLHQYRILKVFVIAIAIFAWFRRREIFTRRLYNRFFLFVIFAEALVRLHSIFTEGRPANGLIGATIAGIVFGISIWLYTRHTLED